MDLQVSEQCTDKRYGFGENWIDYSKHINENRIKEAIKSLERFLDPKDCIDKTFLDIGCGSGLFSLAALKLGFSKVLAIDYDPNSVKATNAVLNTHAPNEKWQCQVTSVFDLDPSLLEQFDVVYSWGVLHHTGDMLNAIQKAANMVKPGGIMILALYRKTFFCPFWTWEKKLYNNGPRWFPVIAEKIYKLLYCTQLMLRGKNINQFAAEYETKRGMHWHHDIVDWLGGYPYESISPNALKSFVNPLGFQIVKEYVTKQKIGLLGSGCDEFCFKRKT